MKYITYATVILASIITLTSSARATTVTATDVGDTFVDSAQPNSNLGGAGAMQVTAPGTAQGTMVSLIKFDPTSLDSSLNSTYGAGGWVLNSVTLTLASNFYTEGTQPNNNIFAPINSGSFEVILMQNSSWVEGTGSPGSPTTDGLTYNQLPSYTSAADIDLGTFAWTAASAMAGSSASYSFNLGLNSTLISDLISGQNVSLEFVAADSGISFLFNTKTKTGSSPVLSVDAEVVPEPGINLLLGLSLLALFGRPWWTKRLRACRA